MIRHGRAQIMNRLKFAKKREKSFFVGTTGIMASPHHIAKGVVSCIAAKSGREGYLRQTIAFTSETPGVGIPHISLIDIFVPICPHWTAKMAQLVKENDTIYSSHKLSG